MGLAGAVLQGELLLGLWLWVELQGWLGLSCRVSWAVAGDGLWLQLGLRLGLGLGAHIDFEIVRNTFFCVIQKY